MAGVQDIAQFVEALQQLGWGGSVTPIESADRRSFADCWFRRWLAGPQCGLKLNAVGHRQLQRLVEAGWSLRSEWPRDWNATVTQWLGRRFFVGRDSLFSNSRRYYSLVSSRIGRDGSHYPQWPQWIDGALRHVRRTEGGLLVAPGSTLSAAVEQFATAARLPVTTVSTANTADLASWLQTLLAKLSALGSQGVDNGSQLYLSPALDAPDERFAPFPPSDRLVMALADRVIAMVIRHGGAIDQLVRLRLADPAFPTGTLFVTLPEIAPQSTGKSSASATSRAVASSHWLTRGAVGWVVVRMSPEHSGPLYPCRLSRASQPSLQQLTAPLPLRWAELAASDDWPYLVHCTRGTNGRQLEESEASFRRRAWSQGETRAWHPMETLARICREGRLRAAAAMTRTREPCVSFSAVPIVPLLRRRVFRSHLGRWDWEPYGLLIRLRSLQDLGAREVIYGTEVDFQRLSDGDKPLFQPNWRKQAHEPWSDEREWRMLGDVNLHSLPSTSICVFVRTRDEARCFSRHSPWPVLWVE